MITALMGHRGVGKSSLLWRISQYARDSGLPVICDDLDVLVEREQGRAVSEIFSNSGEPEFRRIEQEGFSAWVERARKHEGDCFIALGAGFLGEIPEDVRVIWVRRPTDSFGRIFLDRPRLDKDATHFLEYVSRFAHREERYGSRADEILILPEGLEDGDLSEKAFVFGRLKMAGAGLTILSGHFRKGREGFQNWLSKRLDWNLDFIELRDDLLTEEQLNWALEAIAPEKVLFGFRSEKFRETAFVRARKLQSLGSRIDWPAEWVSDSSPAVGFIPDVVSFHNRTVMGSLGECLKHLEESAAALGAPNAILKLAVPILSFAELAEAHQWAAKVPEKRAFLPRTDGAFLEAGGRARWGWYRLINKGVTPLSFVRESEGSSPDQPALLEWCRAIAQPRSFGAVLGFPILHSRSPCEQFEFSRSRKMVFVSVPIEETEWNDALPLLAEMGLRFAAVTSPLKLLAYQSVATPGPLEKLLSSVNTLVWDPDGNPGYPWRGINTDLPALARIWESFASREGAVAVWGGGGTLPILRKVIGQGVFFSARKGIPRDIAESELSAFMSDFSPNTVIWAVGRSREVMTVDPPAKWKPGLVIDLNYSDDSPGREYAARTGATYRSGLEMFREQARLQRKFWSGFLDS